MGIRVKDPRNRGNKKSEAVSFSLTQPLVFWGTGPCCKYRRLEADGPRGASVSASAALGALVGVDTVDVALGDGANGAFVDAGATGNTVVTDYVSH